MMPTTNIAVVRVVAAAVFVGAAGLLVQSFAEGEQNAPQSPAENLSAAKTMAAAGEAAFPDFLVAPVKVKTVEIPVPKEMPSIPAAGDPRWANGDHGVPAAVAPPTEAAVAPPTEPELPADAFALASVQEQESGAGVSMVTGSTSATLEMEIARHGDTRDFDAIDSAVLAAAKQDFAAGGDPPTATTLIVSDVRLRSGGTTRSQVIGVIRGGATVEVVRCASWCEVIHEGRRGWVYSRFVAGYERRKPAVRVAAPAPRTEFADAAAEGPKRSTWVSRLFGNPVKAPAAGASD